MSSATCSAAYRNGSSRARSVRQSASAGATRASAAGAPGSAPAQAQYQGGGPGPGEAVQGGHGRPEGSASGDLHGHRERFLDQSFEAASQHADGSGQEPGRQDGPAGAGQRPHAGRPGGGLERHEGLRVKAGQRSGGGAVEGPATQPGTHTCRSVMLHRRRRFVAHVPSGLDEAPDQIDVLPAPQPWVEQQFAGHLPADQERRTRHVGNTAQGSYQPPRAATVQ